MTPYPPKLLQIIHSHAQSTPHKLALTFLDPSQSYTYFQLFQTIQILADNLPNQLSNQVVILLYAPCLDFILAFLACLVKQIVCVPVYPPINGESVQVLKRICEDCGATVALSHGQWLGWKRLYDLKSIHHRTSWPNVTFINTDKLLKKVIKQNEPVHPYSNTHNPDDRIAFLQYTSGSTSTPKGVTLTHTNLQHNLQLITHFFQSSSSTKIISWLPQYHDMGLIGCYLGVLWCGGSGWYMSPSDFLGQTGKWLEMVEKVGGTHLVGPNFGFGLCARKYMNKPKLNLSTLEHICNGAEPITHQSMTSFINTFRPYNLNVDILYPTYGLAEHTVLVSTNGKLKLHVNKRRLQQNIVEECSEENQDSTILYGCGVPSDEVHVEIVNPVTMERSPVDTVGEIWLDSESKASGYWNKPELTEATFYAKIHGSDSDDNECRTYLRTGDLGFLFNNELFICGRLKDVMIIRGRNYYPQDLEQIVDQIENVRPGCSAAFSIQDDEVEKVILLVELRNVKDMDLKKICNIIRRRIQSEHNIFIYKVCLLHPRTVKKTTSGKVSRNNNKQSYLKDEFKIIYSSEVEGNVSEIEVNNQIEEEKDSIKKKLTIQNITNDISTIIQLSVGNIHNNTALVNMMDSLQMAQLKGMLEVEYGINVEDVYLYQEETSIEKLVADNTGDGNNTMGKKKSVTKKEITIDMVEMDRRACLTGFICCSIM